MSRVKGEGRRYGSVLAHFPGHEAKNQTRLRREEGEEVHKKPVPGVERVGDLTRREILQKMRRVTELNVRFWKRQVFWEEKRALGAGKGGNQSY